MFCFSVQYPDDMEEDQAWRSSNLPEECREVVGEARGYVGGFSGTFCRVSIGGGV